MSWTEQDLRAVLREQVVVTPSEPGRAFAVQARIARRRRRTTVAAASALVLVVAALWAGLRTLPSEHSLPPAGPRVSNGMILFGDKEGDVRVLDPATGVSAVVVGGQHAASPTRTPDGKHILYLRTDEQMFYRANLDGTAAMPFASASDLHNWSYSPSGERIAAVASDGTLAIVDSAGARRAVALPRTMAEVWWTGEDTLLLYAGDGQPATTSLWSVNADGTGFRAVKVPDVCCGTAVNAATARVAWTSWDTSRPLIAAGRTHVLDLVTGTDRQLASTQVEGRHFLDPTFSPDGRWLTVEMFSAGVEGKTLALVAADGTGAAIPLGPRQARNDSELQVVFSPDSRRLLVIYADDGSAWLFDVPSGTGVRTPWSGLVHADWLG